MTYFINKVQNLHVEPEDKLINVDVVAMIIRVPPTDAFNEFIYLFKLCLKTSYLIFNNTLYKQITEKERKGIRDPHTEAEVMVKIC